MVLVVAPPTSGQPLPERDLHALLFDPLSDEFRADPYPVYERLRQERPFFWHPAGFWIVTQFADCAAVLRDRRFRTVDPRAWQTELQMAAAPEASDVVHGILEKTMLFCPPANHPHLRGPLNRAFSPKVMEERRTRVRQIADRLVERFPRGRPFDFIAAFASPFPILVMADLIGIPERDHQKFADWSRTISPILDPLQRPDALAQASRGVQEFQAYMRDLLAQRGSANHDDVLAHMQAPADDGSTLTQDELVANVGLLVAAGHETTTQILGSGLWLLQRNRAAWDELRGDPRLAVGGFEEILRMEPAVQMTIREALEDVRMGPRLVQKGRRVLVLLGAANRDPAVFAHPHTFDAHRHPNEHLAFSAGAHFCLGAALARIEGQEALRALVAAVPDLRLAQAAPRWQSTVTMRGFHELPVIVPP